MKILFTGFEPFDGASVILVTIVCQIISVALAFLPIMGIVFGVTGIFAILAMQNLLRQVKNMEV